MSNLTKSRREFLKISSAAALAGGAIFSVRAESNPSRIALVIGNNAYQQAPLGNAVNDAKAVGTLLERAGFAVTLRTDVNRDALREAAATFGAAARHGDSKLVVFYYAGHGAQMDWRNYLLPVDARVISASDLPAQCLELGTLLSELSRAKDKVFVLILDACRNDPFGASFRPTQKGLSQFDAPTGSLLAFSTAPGSVAADGAGQNGLYTANLVRELSVVGVKLEDALKRVRLAVRLASRGAQVPWESTSLESDVLLFPIASSKMSEAELEADFQRELAVWDRIKGSKEAADWVAYLREYPSGKFSEVAQNRLNYLLRVEEERIALAKSTVVAEAAPVLVPSTAAASATSIPASQPQLQIGPGLPVPVLMWPSPNPASAGTYRNFRQYSVGDKVVYSFSDGFLLHESQVVTHRVTSVDEEADRIEINGGRLVLDGMGSFLKSPNWIYHQRHQMIPAQLQVGNKWTTRFNATTNGRTYEAYYDYRVVGREKVRVPAGEFDAFKVAGYGFNNTSGHQLTHRHWVVPGFNFFLRSEYRAEPRSGSPDIQVYELISCAQMRWSAV